jgi:hypothetical protein
MIEIRKIITTRETVFSELGVEASRPTTRAIGIAVIRNPFAGQFVEDLRPLFEAGAMLGERLMPELVKLLDGPAVSYGKGAIVGVAGEMEHGGACVHPMLGKPMRTAISGGKAVIGSNVKVAAAGASSLRWRRSSILSSGFGAICAAIGSSERGLDCGLAGTEPVERAIELALLDGAELEQPAQARTGGTGGKVARGITTRSIGVKTNIEPQDIHLKHNGKRNEERRHMDPEAPQKRSRSKRSRYRDREFESSLLQRRV